MSRAQGDETTKSENLHYCIASVAGAVLLQETDEARNEKKTLDRLYH